MQKKENLLKKDLTFKLLQHLHLTQMRNSKHSSSAKYFERK